MSKSFGYWFERFVRWFFNSSPTAVLDDATHLHQHEQGDAERGSMSSSASGQRLTRIDAR